MADTRTIEQIIETETALYVAGLCYQFGLEHSDAIKLTERALTKAHGGELPDDYQSAIVGPE